VLQSLIRKLRTSLAQIDTEMAEKYAKLAEKFAKLRQSSVAYRISVETVRFRYPDYDPDRAQKLISSFMSRHLSTRTVV